MNSDIFNKELTNIKDKSIRESAITILNMLPDYFYHMPASSTGKYHPEFSLGEKGLVRHVKAALYFAEELFINESIYEFDDHEKDLIRMAIMLHDGLKKGIEETQYTLFEHPLIMEKFIIDNSEKLSMKKEDIITVGKMIASHMGQWTKDYFGNEKLPKPETKNEKFVHLCDYLASRKQININFINNEINMV